MGAALEQYLSSFGQSLQQLAQQPGQPPGMQPSSFDQPPSPVGAPSFPPGAGGGAASAPPPDPSFELPQLPGESDQQHQAQYDRSMGEVGQSFETGDPTQLNAAPAPTFEAPGVGQVAPGAGGGPAGGPAAEPGSMEIDDVKSPEDMFAAASPEQISGGADVLEESLKEQGSSLDEAYGQLTGGPPDTRLSREEKAQLLMEFGLGILAQNPMEGEGLAAIGASGLSTMQSARDMKEAKRTQPMEERQAQLEMDLTEAQIAAAQRTNKELTTNSDGNMIIVDTESGRTIKVEDAEGNPVTGDPDNQQRYEREVARDMYRAVRCTGKEGDELERCETAALAYAAGGAGTTLAFPELMDRENTEAALRVLLDDDARFTEHLIPSTGERKTVSEMNGSERAEVVRETAKLWGIDPGEQDDDPPTPGWNNPNIGMTEDEARQLGPNQRIPHPDGGWVAHRNGRLVRLDENGQEMGTE